MKTNKLAPVLLVIFLASMVPALGQQEAADKKKKEEEAKKKREQVLVIEGSKMDAKKDAELDMQKALKESLDAEERALIQKQKEGYIDARSYLRQSEALKDHQKKLEELQSLGENWNSTGNFELTPSFRYKFDDQFSPKVYGIYAGNRENTSLSISKSLEDVTFSTDFFYDVKEESSTISFFVNGTLKSGELKITLKKPNKTAFQEITISPLADVNWNQQFRWDEDESADYLGKWIISISATKAVGNYRVQVNSR